MLRLDRNKFGVMWLLRYPVCFPYLTGLVIDQLDRSLLPCEDTGRIVQTRTRWRDLKSHNKRLLEFVIKASVSRPSGQRMDPGGVSPCLPGIFAVRVVVQSYLEVSQCLRRVPTFMDRAYR